MNLTYQYVRRSVFAAIAIHRGATGPDDAEIASNAPQKHSITPESAPARPSEADEDRRSSKSTAPTPTNSALHSRVRTCGCSELVLSSLATPRTSSQPPSSPAAGVHRLPTPVAIA